MVEQMNKTYVYTYHVHLHTPLITANLHQLFHRGLWNEGYF